MAPILKKRQQRQIICDIMCLDFYFIFIFGSWNSKCYLCFFPMHIIYSGGGNGGGWFISWLADSDSLILFLIHLILFIVKYWIERIYSISFRKKNTAYRLMFYCYFYFYFFFWFCGWRRCRIFSHFANEKKEMHTVHILSGLVVYTLTLER